MTKSKRERTKKEDGVSVGVLSGRRPPKNSCVYMFAQCEISLCERCHINHHTLTRVPCDDPLTGSDITPFQCQRELNSHNRRRALNSFSRLQDKLSGTMWPVTDSASV